MLDTNSELYPYAGKGFKLNMQQTVKDSSAYGLTGTSHTNYPYAYEDGDGTVHFFYKKTENGTTQYLDEDGLNLELTLRSGGGYVITDKSGSKLVFNASGNLENIKDADGNSATLTYISRNNEKGSSVPFLSSITDGAGHKLTFSYNYGSGTDCQLNSITGPYGTVSFNRDSSTSSKIVKVIYPDGKNSTYAYNSDGALTRATSSDGYTLAFTYSTDGSYRVKTVTEYSNKNMTDEGQKIEFDRSIINQTTIRTSGKNYIFNDDDDIITTYQFDTYGRTISSKSRLASGTELGAYCSAYTEGGDSSASTIGKRNRIATEASSGKTINNLLSNHSFEGSGSWSSGYWGSSTYTNNSTCSVTTDDSYIGQKSVKIKIDAVEANGGYSYSQYMAQTLAENKTYTFSGYIKTSSVVAQHATIAGGACLAVRFTTDSGNIYQYSNMVVGTTGEKVDNGWQRMSITFTVPENTTNTKISVLLRNATGTAYFDCVQLESGSAENEYNLLENSGFENGLTSWSKSSDTSAADTVNSDRKHSGISSMYMVGEQGKKKYLTQTVNVSGSENDTYILSGWVKGHAIALTEEDRKLCIGVKITYTDGSTKTKSPAVFNTNVYDWRYSSVVFTLSDGESGTKIPKNIKVYLYYYNQANSIRFDDIKLIKDIAQTYSYDSEGNLISAKQNAQSKTSVSYDTYNNPDVFTDEKGATYTYTYSNGRNKHRLISAVSNHSGITYRYSHNDAGQVTSQYVTSAAGSCIKTSQAHTAENLENNIAACAYLASVSDQHGYKTSYTNDMKRGRIMAVTDPLGNVTSYSYKTVTDDDGNTIARTPYISTIRQTNGADSSQEQSVFFTYSDNFNRLNSIRHNGFYYNFTYDNFGKVLTTGVGNNTLITNRYIAGNGALAGVTYGNGSSVDYTYDSYGRVIAVKKDGTKKYTTVYNSSGYACEHNDYENGLTYSYQYDSLGRLVRQYGNTTSTGETRFVGQYEYDVSNNVTKITNIGDDLSLSTSYSYDKENKPTQTKVGSINYNYTYDGLDRLTKTTVTAVDNPFDITYTYYTSARSNDTETYKTTQIKNENFGYVSNGTADSRGYRYAYDRNGNITSISERSSTGSSYSTKLKYYYDYLGQLVREDNKYLNKTITYTYDNGGNIKKREIYSYTTGDLSAATAQQTINYGYDSVWKDKLTSYNGQTITSDAIGNPLTYRDSMSFTWFGRQLKTANIGGTSISYKYDSDGNRSYKKVGNTVSEYQYLGNKLVYEKKGTTEWAFRYDSNGNLAALTRKTADGASHTYYAVCNSRGDVEELRNSSGAIVARYIYDTWGNTIKVVDKDGVQLTNSNLIALQNPIRYRGYYFDSETGFYYLQSRYYDPEIGRFINADGFVSTGQGVLGNNMFAYCLNNPVNYEDSDGEMAAAEGALAWGMASGGANAWNPAGWIILGATAIAAIGILVIPWDSVGQSISKGWNKVKSSASSASISRSISKAVSKAKTKIRNEKRRYDYWIAAYVEYGDGRGTYIPTTPLSYTRAISYVRGGGSVFADSRNNAYKLAKAVGGGTPACDPAHGGLGYWRHYHATRGGRRIGGHVFYVA